MTGQPGQAGGSFDDGGERRNVAPRPVETESWYPEQDCIWSKLLQSRPIQANDIEYTRGVVLDDHVTCLRQPAQQLAALLVASVHGQASLIGIQTLEDGRFVPPLWLCHGDIGAQPGPVGPSRRL